MIDDDDDFGAHAFTEGLIVGAAVSSVIWSLITLILVLQ